MTRSNIRVKVDLSRYYHDARRCCWVFIDGTKISQVYHIKQHISKLFDISEPYHLCLNDTDYLPPAEDARIVKENETLIVIPGSGLGDEVQSSANSSSQCVQDNEKGSKIFYHKEAQTSGLSVTKAPVSTKDTNTQSNGFLSDSKQDISSIDVTFHSIINDTEADSDTDFKTMDSNVTDDQSIMQKEDSTKRKRVRHRKGKKKVSTFVQNSINDSNIMKKPKIIDSYVISSGKHIRFSFEKNGTETSNEAIDNVSTDDQSVIETSANQLSMQCKELSTLLALRNSSTPLTFTNKKIKKENTPKLDDISVVEGKDADASCEKTSETLSNTVEKNISDKDISQKFKNQTLSDAEFQTYPLVKCDAQSDDVIAFKILNFGKDYSPQVSKVIIAQVISFFPQTGVFNLKIIRGLDEVHFEKVPLGKFSLAEEEKENVTTDTININYTQMIEARFIKRSSTSRANSVC